MEETNHLSEFDQWNVVSKATNQRKPINFKEGEVWWARIGVNIGQEMNGKGEEFVRPIVILKKYNQFSLLGAPTTTTKRENIYRVSVGEIGGKATSVNLSQIRSFDSRRLIRKIQSLDNEKLSWLKKKASELNFG